MNSINLLGSIAVPDLLSPKIHSSDGYRVNRSKSMGGQQVISDRSKV